MPYTEFQTLKLQRRGPVGWLLFNRPERLNAMNSVMREELADAWLELDRDPEVRVIVHTGEGRAFQTGVDVAELATDGLGMERYRESPAAMAATKRALWGALETGHTEACRRGAAELVSVWGHPDQNEGPRAFAEKREPQWVKPERAEPVRAEPEGSRR